MVLRAENADLTRALRLYDDLNSFLAHNFFVHTRYNHFLTSDICTCTWLMYYFHSSILNVFARLIALMYIHILFLFNLHSVSEAISTIRLIIAREIHFLLGKKVPH